MNDSLDAIGRLHLGMMVREAMHESSLMGCRPGGNSGWGSRAGTLGFDLEAAPSEEVDLVFGIPGPAMYLTVGFENDPEGKGRLVSMTMEHDLSYESAEGPANIEGLIAQYVAQYGNPEDEITGEGAWGADSEGGAPWKGTATYRIWRQPSIVTILRAGRGSPVYRDPIMGDEARTRLTRETFRDTAAARSLLLKEITAFRRA